MDFLRGGGREETGTEAGRVGGRQGGEAWYCVA
jgi:hypothetical protein